MKKKKRSLLSALSRTAGFQRGAKKSPLKGKKNGPKGVSTQKGVKNGFFWGYAEFSRSKTQLGSIQPGRGEHGGPGGSDRDFTGDFGPKKGSKKDFSTR